MLGERKSVFGLQMAAMALASGGRVMLETIESMDRRYEAGWDDTAALKGATASFYVVDEPRTTLDDMKSELETARSHLDRCLTITSCDSSYGSGPLEDWRMREELKDRSNFTNDTDKNVSPYRVSDRRAKKRRARKAKAAARKRRRAS